MLGSSLMLFLRPCSRIRRSLTIKVVQFSGSKPAAQSQGTSVGYLANRKAIPISNLVKFLFYKSIMALGFTLC